jgi:hypothetical protein
MLKEKIEHYLTEMTEYSLDDLKGGTQFLPPGSVAFIIKDGKIYKRGAHQSEKFIEISKKEAHYSLQLTPELKDIFWNSTTDNLATILSKKLKPNQIKKIA